MGNGNDVLVILHPGIFFCCTPWEKHIAEKCLRFPRFTYKIWPALHTSIYHSPLLWPLTCRST